MELTGMNVLQFRYSADNFGYLVYGRRHAIAIDGGATRQMLAYVKAQGLELTAVTNTHGHADHTAGNQGLLNASSAEFIDYRTLPEKEFIQLENEKVFIYHTPGHTADSICYLAGGTLISGDTLFNGTIGNCFSGDLKGFLRSIKKLLGLPDETVIYAGHDYVKASMAFARSLEPENPAIDRFLKSYDPSHVVSTLGEERRFNPYLKFNDPAIVAVLKRKGLPVATEPERWESLMSLE